jgi:hypothetical protein
MLKMYKENKMNRIDVFKIILNFLGYQQIDYYGEPIGDTPAFCVHTHRIDTVLLFESELFKETGSYTTDDEDSLYSNYIKKVEWEPQKDISQAYELLRSLNSEVPVSLFYNGSGFWVCSVEDAKHSHKDLPMAIVLCVYKYAIQAQAKDLVEI